MSSACLINLILVETSFAACTPSASSSGCFCSSSTIYRNNNTGAEAGGLSNIMQCANASDTACSTITSGSINTALIQHYKNTVTGDYYLCYWQAPAGFASAQIYNPSGGIVNAPINLNFNTQVETTSTDIEIK